MIVRRLFATRPGEGINSRNFEEALGTRQNLARSGPARRVSFREQPRVTSARACQDRLSIAFRKAGCILSQCEKQRAVTTAD